MTLFSLISGTKVHLAPGEKRLPASDYALLVTAEELVKKVESEAKTFRKEVAIEAETIKEEAFLEGFQEGLQSWNHQLLAMEKKIKELREEVTEKILPIALTAAKKIFGEELKLHPDRIADIVRSALKPVLHHKRIHIYVNKTDLPFLEKQKEELKGAFEQLENLILQERADVEPGGCIIETEAGIINAQLETQWRALEAAFRNYIK
ncbi:MAG: HrpE/YscL family type III secretion apparatus protein [Verrucomicrobiota bacterium]|nr:HrpE/YscL family type III secretion apparatus protein [Verrucomicrobiota bacterium]